MDPSTAITEVNLVCINLEEKVKDFSAFPEPFELLHLVAINKLALSERLRNEAAKYSQYTAMSDKYFKEAEKFFIDAHAELVSLKVKVPGHQGGNLAELADAKRKRLLSEEEPGSNEDQVKNVLKSYGTMLRHYVFTSKDEAVTNVARYIQALSFNAQKPEEMNALRRGAQLLTVRFPDNKAAQQTLEFYKEAL